MRIKSYFAPSVQAAIALARKEFGDGVTLVTSHVASLDNRHLGEYEVVFAIEEVIEPPVPEPMPDPAPESPAPAFSELLQQALETPPPMHQDLDGKLEQIHSSLISLGLESSLVRSFMTMLKAVLPAVPDAPASVIAEEPEVVLEEPVAAAEEHTQSVLESPEEEPVLLPAIMPPPTMEELPAPKPKITVIKSEPQILRPEPTPANPAPRPFLSLFEAPRPESRFSAAELAFMSSVSSSGEQKA